MPMQTEHLDAPADAAWDDARRRYETTDEPVTAIAASLGLTQLKLVHEARKRRWTLRRKKQAEALNQGDAANRA